jgi:hypothetical protein
LRGQQSALVRPIRETLTPLRHRLGEEVARATYRPTGRFRWSPAASTIPSASAAALLVPALGRVLLSPALVAAWEESRLWLLLPELDRRSQRDSSAARVPTPSSVLCNPGRYRHLSTDMKL